MESPQPTPRVATGLAMVRYRASPGRFPTAHFPAVEDRPVPLIAPRRRGPLCIRAALRVQPGRESATAHRASFTLCLVVVGLPLRLLDEVDDRRSHFSVHRVVEDVVVRAGELAEL